VLRQTDCARMVAVAARFPLAPTSLSTQILTTARILPGYIEVNTELVCIDRVDDSSGEVRDLP